MPALRFEFDADTGQMSAGAEDFDLTSALFTVLDLDTWRRMKTVSFNGGGQLTGVGFDITNAVANSPDNPVKSASITATSGEIVVQAGLPGPRSLLAASM